MGWVMGIKAKNKLPAHKQACAEKCNQCHNENHNLKEDVAKPALPQTKHWALQKGPPESHS